MRREIRSVNALRATAKHVACVASACAALTMLSQIAGCSSGQIAGTGSQAGNGRVVATAYTAQGQPAAGVSVILHRSDYLLDTSAAALAKRLRTSVRTVTGADGSFSIDSLDTGAYTIEVNDNSAHAALLACTLGVGDDEATVDSMRMLPYATLSGAVPPPQDGESLYAQVYGLERMAPVDRLSGAFRITDLPQGRYTVRIMSTAAAGRARVIDSVVTAAGRNSVIPLLQGWTRRAQVRINTAAAGVDSVVTGFPLLVRLDETTFPFAQAAAGGRDLRFVNSRGLPLPLEIEQWDDAGRTAAIWVRVDTIRGGDSTQTIVMLWGNPAAQAASDGAAVFGAQSGFARAYHLLADLADAAGRGLPGVDGGTAAATGTIGPARRFDSSSIAFDSLDFGDSFTLSLWYRPDARSRGLCPLIANTAGGARLDGLRFFVNTWDSTGLLPPDGRLVFETGVDTANLAVYSDAGRVSFAAPTAWHHLAVTVDRARGTCRLYCDGTQTGYQANWGVRTDFRTAGPWLLGGFMGPWGRLTGEIDEVEISSSARPAAWLRLAYESQRPGQQIVSVEP